MVCLLSARWAQLSVSVGNGWPHNALQHHWIMPISCHFRDCKALLVTSLTHVSGALASVQTFPPLLRYWPVLVLPSCNFIGHQQILPNLNVHFYASARAKWPAEALCPRVVHLSFLLFVAFVTKLVNAIFWRRMNQFWYKLAQVVYGAVAWNDQLWESQDQRSRSHGTKRKIPFGKISPDLCDESKPNPAGTYCGKHPLCCNSPDAKGHGHMKPKLDLAAWERHHSRHNPFG